MNLTKDHDSSDSLAILNKEEQVKTQRVPGVRTVLIVLSSRGMAFDSDSLRQKVLLSYPDSTVFLMTSLGKTIGASPPKNVDLVIDLIGPKQREKWFLSKKLRGMARVAVGRNAGFFRSRIYDRIFDEKLATLENPLQIGLLDSEEMIQKRVLQLAGVAVVQYGETLPDLGKSLPRDLPPLQNL